MVKPSPPKDRVLAFHREEHEDAARVAMKWLADRHRKARSNAFTAFQALLRPESRGDGLEIDEDLTEMLSVNAVEWLVARGEMFVTLAPLQGQRPLGLLATT